MAVTEQPLGPGLNPEEQTPGVAAGLSVLDHVRQVEKNIAAEDREPLTLAIPAWQGALAVRFQYPEGGATPVIRASFRLRDMNPEKAVDAAIDIILGAAYEVVGKRPEDDDWQPLDATGSPVGVGPRLAQLLGIEIDRATKKPNRALIRMLWSRPVWLRTGKYEGDIALINQAGEVAEWLQGEQQAGGEDLEGE